MCILSFNLKKKKKKPLQVKVFSEAGGRAPYPETLASSSWAGSGYKSRSHINILLEESGVKRPWEALTKAVVFTYHLSFPRKAQ